MRRSISIATEPQTKNGKFFATFLSYVLKAVDETKRGPGGIATVEFSHDSYCWSLLLSPSLKRKNPYQHDETSQEKKEKRREKRERRGNDADADSNERKDCWA